MLKETCAPRCRDHRDLFVAPSLSSKAHIEKGIHKPCEEQYYITNEKCHPSNFFD